MRSGSFESLRSVKNLERLSKKQSNNQATDQSGTVDFFSAVLQAARAVEELQPAVLNSCHGIFSLKVVQFVGMHSGNFLATLPSQFAVLPFQYL